MFKKCDIIGFDGLDWCIAQMTASVYLRAGFDTRVYCGKPKINDSDSLVILRGAVPHDIDLSGYDFVHLYGYAWQLDASYVKLLTGVNHKIIVPDPKYLPNGYTNEFGTDNVIISYPPVVPDFWYYDGPSVIKGDFIHIGHYKPIVGDEQHSAFINILKHTKADVYGNGWDEILPQACIKGPIELKNVSETYSSYRYALGLMYPYQRGFSISGRFFQAPLSGCSVITEAIPNLSLPPGLIEFDWTKPNFSLFSFPTAPSTTKDDAYQFWLKSTLVLIQKLNLSPEKRFFPVKNYDFAVRIIRELMN